LSGIESSPLMFGQLAMGAIAAGFVRRFRQIHLEVTVEDRHVDLIDEGYDVVIRINSRTDSQLVGRCFHRDELLLVAPVDLARPSDSETPVPTVTGSSAPDLKKRSVIDGNVERRIMLKTVLRLPSPLMMRDAVLAGAGLGILPRMLTTNPACLRHHTAQAGRCRKSCRMTLTRRRYLVTGPMPLAETSLLQGKPMTDSPNKSRQQAEIAFARTQSVSLERANTAARVDPATQERRDKTLRLKNARLARDSADNEVPAFTRLTDDDKTDAGRRSK
jgi:hypothetical protein